LEKSGDSRRIFEGKREGRLNLSFRPEKNGTLLIFWGEPAEARTRKKPKDIVTAESYHYFKLYMKWKEVPRKLFERGLQKNTAKTRRRKAVKKQLERRRKVIQCVLHGFLDSLRLQARANGEESPQYFQGRLFGEIRTKKYYPRKAGGKLADKLE